MEKNKNYKIYRIVMIIAISVFITFMVTSISLYTYFTKNPMKILASSRSTSNSESLDISNLAVKLKSYKEILEKYYLGEIDEEKLEESAISGYISGLGDPYTEYISKDEMEDYLQDTKGNFSGIGIRMVKNTQKNRVQIYSVIKDTPAEKAGLKAGDLIISVEGTGYTADDMDTIASKIKGEIGTKVKLQILRDENQTLDFEIERQSVKMNPVESKVLKNNIGYIAFSSFDETTSEDFKSEYQKLEKQGIKSLIIDLRNNGGGIVNEALEIADYMTDKDSVLLYEVDKNGNEEIKKSKANPIINMPIVLLVNEGTASASEILAGALKDLGKAKIVGTQTYGKGVIQQILKLSDGSGLKVTIEEYQTPNKNKINQIGITPDEVVELNEGEEDNQLQKAIEMLAK